MDYKKPCKMYTLNQVAQILGTTPFTVRNWAKTGKIKAVKIPDDKPQSQWFVPSDEIIKLQQIQKEEK